MFFIKRINRHYQNQQDKLDHLERELENNPTPSRKDEIMRELGSMGHKSARLSTVLSTLFVLMMVLIVMAIWLTK